MKYCLFCGIRLYWRGPSLSTRLAGLNDRCRLLPQWLMSDHKRKEKEQLDAEQRSSPSGKVVYKAILLEGMDELSRPSSALFWSGLAAGLSMGTSLIAEGLLPATCRGQSGHR